MVYSLSFPHSHPRLRGEDCHTEILKLDTDRGLLVVRCPRNGCRASQALPLGDALAKELLGRWAPFFQTRLPLNEPDPASTV